MKPAVNFAIFNPLGLICTVGTIAAIAVAPVAIVQAQVSPRYAQNSFPGRTFVRRDVSGPAPNGRYRGGGSRSANRQDVICPETKLPLTALVPFEEIYDPEAEELPPITRVWGYTTAEHPTVWLYVPYSNAAIPATLSLEDDTAKKTLYTVPVSLPGKAGIIGVQLPENQPGLENGKRYRWFFSLDCKSPSTTVADEIYIEAVILRDQLPTEIMRQLTPTPSLENASIYAQHGFWHNALTTLATLKQQNPEDSTTNAAWRDLLSHMPLSERSKPTFYANELSSVPLVK